jgi:hypothetical protein
MEPIELVTGQPIAEPLHRYFQRREGRRRSGRAG